MEHINQLLILGKYQKTVNINDKISILFINYNTNDKKHHLLPIEITNCIAKRIKEYCKTNDIIAIKGSVSTNKDNQIIIIGDKITFLKKN